MKRKIQVPCSSCRFASCAGYRQFSAEELQWVAEYKIGDLVIEGGEQVLAQGAPSPYLYTLYDGWAYRYKTLENGERQILDFCFPGDFIGLQGSMFGSLDHAVATLTGCHFCIFPRARVWELFSRHPVQGYGVTWISSGHERLLDTRILALGKLNAESKIAHLVLSIRDRLVALGAALEQVLPWPLTQEQIADCLGMTSVHVSRIFKRLAARGLIAVERREIRILAPAALEELACYEPPDGELRPYL